MPIACSRRIDTRLRDFTSASRRRIGPAKSPLEFSGRQASSMLGSSMTKGASRISDAVVKPLSSAAEYRKGLKPEPGWRLACVARLNLPTFWSK